MSKRFLTGLLALGVAVAGCSDFLTGPKLSDNPNQPTSATNPSLFVATQADLYLEQEGPIARIACTWMQQCAAIGANLSFSTYGVSDQDFDDAWTSIYGGGGLIDLRRVERSTLAAGDSTFSGMARVLEAVLMGTAADVWGAIPYSQAVDTSIVDPVVDPQDQVYAAIQAKLDTAITYLAAIGPTNTGPAGADLTYFDESGTVQDERAKWTELAYTLKARYYMHTAEVVGGPAYQAALAAAQLGISSQANDYTAYHSSAASETNLWYQFETVYPTYQAAGSFLVDLLLAGNDLRLGQYFIPNQNGDFVGVVAGTNPPISDVADLNALPDQRQPLVTWAENQLIMAEASYQQAGGGSSGNTAAQPFVDAVRSQVGLAPKTVTSLNDIMSEKYAALFENIEVWSDYKRTCLPALPPAGTSAFIPGRLVYPLRERNANSNITDVGPLRNWNDPNPCP
jgi:starch-binding outer membrane protein, SusD/RagB family